MSLNQVGKASRRGFLGTAAAAGAATLTAAPTGLLIAASAFAKAGMAQTIEGTPRPKDMPPEMMAIIETVIRGFNSKDLGSFKKVYGNNPVIIDGYAPYRWTGQNAVTDWWADGEEWDNKLGVAKADLVYEGILAWGVAGARGYTSVSAVLTFTFKDGRSMVRPGILTLTYAKLDGTWKVDGQSWARLS